MSPTAEPNANKCKTAPRPARTTGPAFRALPAGAVAPQIGVALPAPRVGHPSLSRATTVSATRPRSVTDTEPAATRPLGNPLAFAAETGPRGTAQRARRPTLHMAITAAAPGAGTAPATGPVGTTARATAIRAMRMTQLQVASSAPEKSAPGAGTVPATAPAPTVPAPAGIPGNLPTAQPVPRTKPAPTVQSRLRPK